MPLNSGINSNGDVSQPMKNWTYDPFDRSLNSVIYSVVANCLDVKKRGGGRLQWKATRRLLSP